MSTKKHATNAFTFSYTPKNGQDAAVEQTVNFNTDLISNEEGTGIADLAKLKVKEVDKSQCTDTFAIPEVFDYRKEFFEYLPKIGNQGDCGSCWSFASSFVLSARFALATNQRATQLSTVYNLFCAKTKFSEYSNDGCKGDTLLNAFYFFTLNGTITEKCLPYNLAQWTSASRAVSRRMYESDTVLSSKDTNYKNLSITCPMLSCITASSNPKDVESIAFYKARVSYIVAGSTRQYGASDENIRLEMIANGPVASGFEVRADFFDYWKNLMEGVLVGKDLIYQPKPISDTNESLGGHAIVIVGWDIIDGVKCWIIANSWGATVTDFSVDANLVDYGDNGYFLFPRGSNSCGIESNVVAGIPKVGPNIVSATGFTQHDRNSRICGLITYEINPDTLSALQIPQLEQLPDTLSLLQWKYPPNNEDNIGMIHEYETCPSTAPFKCTITKLCTPDPSNCGQRTPLLQDKNESTVVKTSQLLHSKNNLSTNIDAVISSYENYKKEHLLSGKVTTTKMKSEAENTASCSTECMVGIIVGGVVFVTVIVVIILYKVKPTLFKK